MKVYNKKILISTILGLTGIFLIIVFALPKILYIIEVNKLEEEIYEIKDSLKDMKEERKDLEKKLANSIFVFSKSSLEEKVENNLKEYIDISYKLYEIENNSFYIDAINKEILENEEKIEEELIFLENSKNDLLNKVEKIEKLKEIYLSKEELENIKSKTLKVLDNLELLNKALTYLKDNKESYDVYDKIIFKKKKVFLGYQEIISFLQNEDLNIMNFTMENDNNAPIVTPDSLEVFVGSKSLGDYISCIDEIDGEVECRISGDYNLEVVGNYNVFVEARDSSSNYIKRAVNLNVNEKVIGPYYTEIIRNQNTVIVYGLDENKRYTKVVKVFACSTGRGGRTPTGTFYSTKGAIWGPLMGGVWGQYYTVITKNILFHSVPYYSMSKDNLEWEEYNKLGTSVSAGCVRLSTIDAKWIYDNCPSGMRIRIYDGELPNGIEKPVPIKIDESSPFKGWDPTDPDINNPWNQM